MSTDNWSRGAEKCREKTRRGNCYRTAYSAWQRAREMTARIGAEFNAFRCLFCDRWHVGRVRPPAERARRSE